MPKAKVYVALIRAVNVGGHSIMRMPVLRQLIESLGFEDVKTYIQTGNVIFKSTEIDSAKLATKIEKGIEAGARYKTTVFVLTPEELREAAKNNPFKAKNEAGEGRSH